MQDMDKIYKKYGEIVYKYVFCLTGNEDTKYEKVVFYSKTYEVNN